MAMIRNEAGELVGATTEDAILATLRQGLGQHGFSYATGNNAVEGNYTALFALEDATFSAMAGDGITDNVSGLVLKAGMTIYGAFTSLTLTSGKIIAYKA